MGPNGISESHLDPSAHADGTDPWLKAGIQRQVDSKGRSFPDLRGCLDAPTVGPRNAPHRGQTQTGPTFGGREEGIEDLLEVLLGNSATGIGNFDDGFFDFVCLFAANANRN